MRLVLVAFVAAGLFASPVRAADQPVIAPAPAWVKPLSIPADDAKADEAPIRFLLSDQQIALEPGRQAAYNNVAIKIQTPQGLAAGSLSIPWRPETDTLTVHKLAIHRGEQVIDILAAGQTFTVLRRETNLEMAMLDGVLTANIQPEGLQVGDILEFAMTIESRDPVMKGHVEQVAATWNGAMFKRAHFKAHWPTSLPVKVRQTGLYQLKPVRDGANHVVELSLDDVQPLIPPKGAPTRFLIGRLAQLSDFASWAEVANLMAPLYQQASLIKPETALNAELTRIRTASQDPKIRAEAALALVQDRIRYVALLMGVGGYTPADAETTWSRRYGDCKAKTALLLALLHALEIEAEPVAVNTQFGDGIDERLPMLGAFNHVLVRATIAGKTYWMDGTRTGDTSLDRLRMPPFHWGLPLVASPTSLVRMMPPPLDVAERSKTIKIDATAGLSIPAQFHVEEIFRGDGAIALNAAVAQLTATQRDNFLREYWKDEFDFVDLTSASSSFDPKSGEMRLVMDGLAKLGWEEGWYEADDMSVGYKADLSRPDGPSREAPFAVEHPFFNHVKEVISLPPGFDGTNSKLPEDVETTVAGVEYRRHATLANNVFTIEKTVRSIAHELPFAEAAAAEKTLRELAEKRALIARPATYRLTPKEVAAQASTSPTTASEYVDRGNALLDMYQFDKAIADFTKAVELEPKNVWALADRGLAHVWKGELDAAVKDLDAAAAIDPENAVIYRARGLMAQNKGDWKVAVEAYSASLEKEPNNHFALGRRAEAHRALGNLDQALADAAAALKISPQWVALHMMRANMLRQQGKNEEALAEAVAVAGANPDNEYAQVIAAGIYSALNKQEEAMRAYERALTIKPAAYIYMNRSESRPKEDVAGRLADVDEAIKLEPKMWGAMMAKARIQSETGDHSAAAATLSKALSVSEDPHLLAERGVVYARLGKMELANKDFAAARAKATEPVQLNNICWTRATAGVALESALADCDAALAKSPDVAGFLDSRALVLLRMNRLDEAIANYDRALAKEPDQSSSLFGRAVAYARRGDKEKSEADLAAALKANPKVQERFAEYGIGF